MARLRLDRRLQGRADPSDELQEAFFDVAHRAREDAMRPQMPFFLWLRLITGQKLLERHRAPFGAQTARCWAEFAGPRLIPQVSPAQCPGIRRRHSSASHAATRAEQQAKLEQFLCAMEPIDREVLTLWHFEELSNGEVCAGPSDVEDRGQQPLYPRVSSG